MHLVTLDSPDDFDGWRAAARALALADIRPDRVTWHVAGEEAGLFGGDPPPPAQPGAAFNVPRPFVDLARSAILHADAERFARLYAMLLRVRAQPGAMQDRADPDLRGLEDMAKQVRQGIHKMRAFVRFRTVEDGEGERYVAWFEPEHHIVRRNAAFFVDRFASIRWSILTPELSIHWDGETLTESPGAAKADAPDGDPTEEVWKIYYASIFNPARLKTGAMLKEMPRKYWKNMPETALVPGLIAGAQAREAGMIEKARVNMGGNSEVAWDALREEAMGCTRCHLYKHATQTVFGEGPMDAPMMLVGEQPGDQEDLAGRAFVGPAGKVLDEALAAAGIDRASTYVTNAVKHFKFEQRGKRRIHSKPDAGEIEACRWWIGQELDIVRPQVTVALGATAARSLFGKVMTIGKERGRVLELPGGGAAFITVHPSYLLRIPDAGKAVEEKALFIQDLKLAKQGLSK